MIKRLNTKVRLIVMILISICSSNISFASQPTANSSSFISYDDSGKGVPLVLIHAFPTDQRLWNPQKQALNKFFRVITLDLWGFGQSTPVDGNTIAMSEYADQVKRLMDQLKIDKAIIAGESMGGYIALAFLEKYPEHVQGLILSDTQSKSDTPEAKAKREETAQAILKNGPDNLIKNFLANALSTNAPDKIKATLKRIVDAQPATAMASALRGMADRKDTSSVLAGTQLPVLILTGDKDTVISPQESSNMHALAKNSQLVVIEDAGHLSSLEQADKWSKAVISMYYQPKSN